MSDAAYDRPFDDTRQNVVLADGTLTFTFTPDYNSNWSVEQVSLEMPSAPAGASVTVRKDGFLIAPAFSARRAALGGDPPVFLRPGERLTVNWINCTPGDTGKVLVLYRKVPFG